MAGYVEIQAFIIFPERSNMLSGVGGACGVGGFGVTYCAAFVVIAALRFTAPALLFLLSAVRAKT